MKLLVDRAGRVFENGDGEHDTILKKLGIKDRKVFNRDFVRISVLEFNGSLSVGVDETDTIPPWFNEEHLGAAIREYYNKTEENP